ncbi:desumoylating isopeptidase 1 [Nematocida sp. AWRm80]|nr:desumoylating isopeptidase 1 [Nematocida sp. AWRm80]
MVVPEQKELEERALEKDSNNEVSKSSDRLEVELWVYDISNPILHQLLSQFLQLNIDGIWHSSVVVFGKEYYYFNTICTSTPGNTHFGIPKRKISFGSTKITETELNDYIKSIYSRYSHDKYDILDNNCNHFTNHILEYLVDKQVPEYIMNLSEHIKNTPFAELIRSMTKG